MFTKASLVEGPGRRVVHGLKRDSILREAEASARRLGVDAIDLYQIHWPIPEEDIEEGWAAFAELKEQGLVRHIGVSNFDVDQVRRAAFVLVALANHADPDGHNAFPAVATLVRYTRLSERSVQYSLRSLEELGLITPSDPDIVAAYVKRADRRPRGWDLPVHSAIHNVIHTAGDGVHAVHPAGSYGVQIQAHGVQTTPSRGARRAPEPS